MHRHRRRIALGALALIASGIMVVGACNRGDRVVSQETQTQASTDELGPAPSQFWSATVHSTGKPNQKFHITDPATPPTMISVEVYTPNGQIEAWEEVEDLREAGPDDQVFSVEVLFNGTPLICFGDGEHGAIPPARERGIRVRSVGPGGSPDGVIPVETGVRRFDRAKVKWLKETVGDETTNGLLDDARAKTYRILTCKLREDGSATTTRWEVPGPALAPFLSEVSEQSNRVGEVLSIETVDVETRGPDE